MLLPLQWYAPSVEVYSLGYIVFGVLIVYLVFWRPQVLGRIWRHPISWLDISGLALVSLWNSPTLAIGLMIL